MGNQKLFQSPNAGGALGFGGLQSASPMQNQFGMPHVPAWQQEQNMKAMGGYGMQDEGEDPFLQSSGAKN